MINILISKAGKTLSVDWDNMPANAQRHIIEYGLKQKLNDAGSSATVKELGEVEAGNQAFAAAEIVVAALARGDVTVRQAAKAESLEEKEYKKLLKALLKKAFPQELEALLATPSDAIEALAGLHKVSTEKMELALQAKAKANAEIERKKRELSASLSILDL